VQISNPTQTTQLTSGY